MGLQFFGECFCGETYYSAEDGPIPSDNCYTPCDGDADVICGGPWTNSVYIVGDPAEKTQEEIDVSHNLNIERGTNTNFLRKHQKLVLLKSRE